MCHRKDYGTDPRAQQMAAMYRQGMTLAKIGEQFGVTRERIRQLVKKLGAERSGLELRSQLKAQRAAQKVAAREAKCITRWGVGTAEWRQLRADGTIRAYEYQKRNSKTRGISFQLTFPQWHAIWLASGKFHLRGRGADLYCMSRLRDDGPYAVGNVHIKSLSDNSREAVKKWAGAPTKEFRGVFNLYPGRANAYLAKVGNKRLGYHPTAEEAAEARRRYIEENGIRTSSTGCVRKGRREEMAEA